MSSVYFIAEIGSNWATESQCMDSITQAKKAGADAVKFQFFRPAVLYGPTGVPAEEAWGKAPYLHPDTVARLAEKARNVGIDFLCTAFDAADYAFIDRYVSMHKIASAEAGDVGILHQVRALGKPVLLSTGAQHFEEIAYSLKRLGEVPVTLLHCVASYPAREARLGRIAALRDTFGRPVGYSDHTTSIDCVPLMAAQMGATVIEKHVTNYPDLNTPDRPHSLTMEEFKRMVEHVRTGVTPDANQVSREEKDMILRHKRRLKAIVPIALGDELKNGVNFGSFRSLTDDSNALPPRRAWDEDGKPGANGKRAKRAMQVGDGVGPGDF